jgi:hypothetical protein
MLTSSTDDRAVMHRQRALFADVFRHGLPDLIGTNWLVRTDNHWLALGHILPCATSCIRRRLRIAAFDENRS